MKIHTGLIDIGIIKEKKLVKEFHNKGDSKLGFAYSLVENHETLYNILDYLINSNLPIQFIDDIINDIMTSEYGRRLINLKIVNKIESRFKSPLNNEEKNFILNILKISKTALYETLKKIYNNSSWDKWIEPVNIFS